MVIYLLNVYNELDELTQEGKVSIGGSRLGFKQIIRTIRWNMPTFWYYTFFWKVSKRSATIFIISRRSYVLITCNYNFVI